MTSFKKLDLTDPKTFQWPNQLKTPKELVDGLKQRTKLRIIRSPLCSKIVLQIVGSWAYLVAHVFNKTRVFNIDTFNNELKRIQAQESQHHQHLNRAPFLTFSNHISCIDDPVLWSALLPLTYYSTSTNTVRWAAAAVEICFSKPWHSTLFSLGRTFPIVRGAGVEQPAMEFASALLNHGQWLHLFPEGRVMRDDRQRPIDNKQRGYVFKWGIAKLILDHFYEPNANFNRDKNLRILPFYHMGLDEILPIGWPYIPRMCKRITIYMKPNVIEMEPKLLSKILNNPLTSDQIYKSRTNDDIKRIKLTNYLEDELEKLVDATEKLHRDI